MDKRVLFAFSLILGIVLALVVLAGLSAGPAVAGPAPAPTPISVPAGGGDWVMATWHSSQVMTDASTSYNGSSFQVAAYTAVDLSYTTDVTSTGYQTATCEIQFSNDDTNWDIAGQNVVLNVDSDTTAITQTNIFGRYCRVTCTVETSNDLTITIKGKLHN